MDDVDPRQQADFDQAPSAGQEVCPECGESVAAEDVYCPHCGELLTAPGAPGAGFDRLPERVGSAAVLQALLIGGGALLALLLMLLFFAVRHLVGG